MARVLAAVPGIVVPFGCIVHENHVAFLMRRQRSSLSALRDSFNALSFKNKLRIFIRIGDSLAQVHSSYAIHNDLKPGNILSADDSFSDIFLADFGGACLQGELCHGGTHMFSPHEKLNHGNKAIGAYSLDVWSYLLTVIVLYAGGGSRDIESILHYNKFACWKHMSVECHDVLKKGLKHRLRRAPHWFIRTVLGGLHYSPWKRPPVAQITQQLRRGYHSMFGA